ncbi:membrane protein [Streptomyces avidinii]
MKGTGGLLARTGSTAPPVTTGREDARQAAREELSKPLYHENDPGLFQRVLNRFWEWVGDLFDHASGATPGGTLGLVAIAVFAVLVVAALWWRLGAPRRAVHGAAGALFDDGIRSAADHRAAADALAAEGRWNEAVQERMRAVVRSLEERTLLDPRPGRTADEAAAEAAASLPSQAEALRAAARTFDDVTYGARPANEAMYASLRTLDQTLTRTKPLLTGPTP